MMNRLIAALAAVAVTPTVASCGNSEATQPQTRLHHPVTRPAAIAAYVQTGNLYTVSLGQSPKLLVRPPTGQSVFMPRLSPDGTLVAYALASNSGITVAIRSVSGGTPTTAVVKGGDISGMAWSASGVFALAPTGDVYRSDGSSWARSHVRGVAEGTLLGAKGPDVLIAVPDGASAYGGPSRIVGVDVSTSSITLNIKESSIAGAAKDNLGPSAAVVDDATGQLYMAVGTKAGSCSETRHVVQVNLAQGRGRLLPEPPLGTGVEQIPALGETNGRLYALASTVTACGGHGHAATEVVAFENGQWHRFSEFRSPTALAIGSDGTTAVIEGRTPVIQGVAQFGTAPGRLVLQYPSGRVSIVAERVSEVNVR